MRTELPLQAMDAAIGGKIADYLGLCKLKVVSLIVFTAVVGMFLAVPGMPPLDKLAVGLGGHRAGRRIGGGDQSRTRRAHRCVDETHPTPAAAHGSSHRDPRR